jgi:hypothetical protein
MILYSSDPKTLAEYGCNLLQQLLCIGLAVVDQANPLVGQVPKPGGPCSLGENRPSSWVHQEEPAASFSYHGILSPDKLDLGVSRGYVRRIEGSRRAQARPTTPAAD